MGYTLTEIVNELLIEQGEGQTNKFARYYQLGVAGLRKFSMNTSGIPKVIELDINSNDIADLPMDYLKYVRIGLCVNGEIYCLGQNNNICLNKKYDKCGDQVSETVIDYSFGYWPFGVNYRNGEFTGGLFGIGADNNVLGYYRIDDENRQIKFSQLTCRSSVVMEYLSDIESINGDFEVHPYCIEPLKDWIAWKLKQRSNKPSNEQMLACDDYKRSLRVMKMQFGSSSIDEWKAAFRVGNNRLKM